METIIQVTEAKKYFKEVKAVDGITLEIKKGEYVAVLGPNGAGKTTLLEMIEGLQKPTSGDISIKGLQWTGNEEKLHRLIGLSLQETRFIDKLKVGETMKLFASFYGLKIDRVHQILELVNLDKKWKAYTKELSGGQRQRLALGVALLNQPEILLLDEPTTGLDPTARREMWDILMKLKKELNTTMILTTHYMEEASYLCERIVIIDQGKVLARGTLKELLSEHNTGEVIDFTFNTMVNEALIPQSDTVIKIDLKDDKMGGEIIVEDLVEYLPIFLKFSEENNLSLSSLECRKMTLDDLFISMTGRHLND